LRGAQTHTWQATLGPRAMVFVTHRLPAGGARRPGPPMELAARGRARPRLLDGQWRRAAAPPVPEPGDLDHAPQYRPLQGLTQFDYCPETHAYFPVAHFDEGAEHGWTFGREATPTWRCTVPADGGAAASQCSRTAGSTNLVAAGSASNVWVVECGSAASGATRRLPLLAPPAADPRVRAGPLPDAAGDGSLTL
jgi:hypothetical protein